MSSRSLSPLTTDARLAAGHRDELDGLAPAVVHGEEHVAESGDQVKLLTQRSRFSVKFVTRPVARSMHHQSPAVTLVAGAELRAPRQILPIG